MGGTSSRPSQGEIEVCKNDYELAIRACKALDGLLRRLVVAPITHEAHHAGLHDVINACKLPHALEKQVRYLTTVRNGLVHDTSVLCLDDRDIFIETFVLARGALIVLLNEKVFAALNTRAPKVVVSSSSSFCAIA